MVLYAEYSNLYNLFDLSSQNTFIERSVQFEEELMQEVELAQGECSHPTLHDDVSDDYLSYFSDSNISEYDDDIHSDHDSSIHPKWV